MALTTTASAQRACASWRLGGRRWKRPCARRATAAAYGAGFATLFLLSSVGPYRRGEVWAWWALLIGMLVVAGLILLRLPLLGTGLSGAVGGGTAMGSLTQLLLVGVGLALGARRLRHGRPGDSA